MNQCSSNKDTSTELLDDGESHTIRFSSRKMPHKYRQEDSNGTGYQHHEQSANPERDIVLSSETIACCIRGALRLFGTNTMSGTVSARFCNLEHWTGSGLTQLQHGNDNPIPGLHSDLGRLLDVHHCALQFVREPGLPRRQDQYRNCFAYVSKAERA